MAELVIKSSKDWEKSQKAIGGISDCSKEGLVYKLWLDQPALECFSSPRIRTPWIEINDSFTATESS